VAEANEFKDVLQALHQAQLPPSVQLLCKNCNKLAAVISLQQLERIVQ